MNILSLISRYSSTSPHQNTENYPQYISNRYDFIQLLNLGNTRRTVIVLSDSFLKQDWSRYDFRSGLQAAMRAGGKRIIFVILGDIVERDLDAELRLHLKTCSVVRWGETKFWQKLKFSLPDLSVHAMSQSTTLQSYPPSVQYNTSELYRPLSPRYQALPRQSDHIYQVCY